MIFVMFYAFYGQSFEIRDFQACANLNTTILSDITCIKVITTQQNGQSLHHQKT